MVFPGQICLRFHFCPRDYCRGLRPDGNYGCPGHFPDAAGRRFCSAVQLVSGILSLELLLSVQPEPVLQALSSVHLPVRSLVLSQLLVLLPLVLLS